MIENAPLLVSTNISNFVVTSFVSWQDIADLLDIGNQLDLSNMSLSPADLASVSLEESCKWATKYERVSGKTPSEEDTLLRENDIVDSIKQYYTAERVVSEQLDVETLVCDLNKWALRGPDRPYLFGNIPDSGVGLHYFKSDIGISFTAHPAFMIPYIELFYDRTQSSPDWGLQEVDGLDIIESLVQLQYKLSKKVVFRLHIEEEKQVWSRRPYEVY